MWDPPLHILGQRKVIFRKLKLSIDLIDGNAMIDQSKKTSSLGSLDQLLGNLLFARLEVCNGSVNGHRKEWRKLVPLNEIVGTGGAASDMMQRDNEAISCRRI